MTTSHEPQQRKPSESDSAPQGEEYETQTAPSVQMSSHDAILRLQRTLGNRAVIQLLTASPQQARVQRGKTKPPKSFPKDYSPSAATTTPTSETDETNQKNPKQSQQPQPPGPPIAAPAKPATKQSGAPANPPAGEGGEITADELARYAGAANPEAAARRARAEAAAARTGTRKERRYAQHGPPSTPVEQAKAQEAEKQRKEKEEQAAKKQAEYNKKKAEQAAKKQAEQDQQWWDHQQGKFEDIYIKLIARRDTPANTSFHHAADAATKDRLTDPNKDWYQLADEEVRQGTKIGANAAQGIVDADSIRIFYLKEAGAGEIYIGQHISHGGQRDRWLYRRTGVKKFTRVDGKDLGKHARDPN